ncbi:unnamed protein product, partial [Polarella glacialis]
WWVLEHGSRQEAAARKQADASKVEEVSVASQMPSNNNNFHSNNNSTTTTSHNNKNNNNHNTNSNNNSAGASFKAAGMSETTPIVDVCGCACWCRYLIRTFKLRYWHWR